MRTTVPHIWAADDIARSLDITLHEEGDADKELSRIARGTHLETGINEVALN